MTHFLPATRSNRAQCLQDLISCRVRTQGKGKGKPTLSAEDQEAIAKRQARFGIVAPAAKAAKGPKGEKVVPTLTPEEEEARAKRAARFGTVGAAAAAPVDPEEEARRAARAARFAGASS